MTAATKWTHDDLLRDLAGHLSGSDRMVWQDMQIGPSGSPRPDVYVIRKSYSAPRPMAYEIKVSVSDLRADLVAGKWQKYLDFAAGVVFAVPDGLCTKADIPAHCGLIVRKAATWRYARKPVLQPVVLGMNAVMKLLIDGGQCQQQRAPRAREFSVWKGNDRVRRLYGEAVAVAARDLALAGERLADIDTTISHIMSRAQFDADLMRANAKSDAEWVNDARAEICGFLGLPPRASEYLIRQKLASLEADLSADARVAQAEKSLASARQTLEHALRQIAVRP